MKVNLYEGETVRHKAKADWGLGKIINVNSCGTIKVIFEGVKEVSIAQGAKFLIKVDKSKIIEACTEGPKVKLT